MIDPEIQTDHDNGQPHVISVYRAGFYIGFVGIGRSIRAVTADGVEIGKYLSVDEARDAVARAIEDGGGQ